jgi:hypothetical protein
MKQFIFYSDFIIPLNRDYRAATMLSYLVGLRLQASNGSRVLLTPYDIKDTMMARDAVIRYIGILSGFQYVLNLRDSGKAGLDIELNDNLIEETLGIELSGGGGGTLRSRATELCAKCRDIPILIGMDIKAGSTQDHRLCSIIDDFANGRFLTNHRWDINWNDSTDVPVELQAELASGIGIDRIAELVHQAAVSLQNAWAVGFDYPPCKANGKRPKITLSDFILHDRDSSRCNSLLLQFCDVGDIAKDVPIEWVRTLEMIYPRNSGVNYEGAIEFCKWLNANYDKFLELNPGIATGGKARALERIMLIAKENPRLVSNPIPAPENPLFSELQSTLYRQGVLLPGSNSQTRRV